jgi:hypothetical protein
VCDRAWFSVFEIFAHVGGNFNNGLNAGLWYWNLNNTSALANFNVGCRVLILKIIIIYTSFSRALARNRVATGLA